MSDNTSGQAGWVQPVEVVGDYDQSLDNLLSRWVRYVTGLGDGMVRARWQQDQPALPPVTTNWCAFGVMDITADSGPAMINQTDSTAESWRHELIDALISFYGPSGQQYASRFRDGIAINQNNATLNEFNLTLADCDSIRSAPELLNNQWVRRYDLRVQMRRKVVSTWNIQSLVEAPVQFFGE
ncbi:hypothetical protein LLP99_16995 [Rouxiella badensis]|uniref:phage neck terminator protein n=1 Tax=Rouxiella badensis TaxID=1646377 RepID=UPI001D14B4B6|nr:hypothetical protein [Rouxiella badensis]MCC3717975.1 hypothetical protein [Rouxiella badensis]MCC3730010.1 hypothetical protein [Rouxiella badensis]